MLASTKLSSKGQLVIPKEVRDVLGLRVGDSMVVAVDGERIILRKLTLDDVLTEAKHEYAEGRTLSHDEAFGALAE